jgi:hypothetical protein
MEYGLEKYARISLKSGKVHKKRTHRNTMENEIKGSESITVHTSKYFGVQESHNTEYKNQKGKLKEV